MVEKIKLYLAKYCSIIELTGVFLIFAGILLKAKGFNYFSFILIPGISIVAVLYLFQAYNPYPSGLISNVNLFLYKLAFLILFILALTIMVMLLEWSGAYLLLFVIIIAFLVFAIIYVYSFIRFRINPKALLRLLVRLLIGVLLALVLKYNYDRHMQFQKKPEQSEKNAEANA